MNKNTQLAVGIIGVLAILIGGYYYLTNQPAAVTQEVATTTPDTTKSKPARAPEPAPSEPAMELYSNPQVGFSFMKPTDWDVESANDTHVTFMINGGVRQESNHETIVTTTVNSGHMTLADLKDVELKKHKDEVVFLGFTDVTLDGKPAFIEQFDGMAPTDLLFAIHNGKVYELSGFIADYASGRTGLNIDFAFLDK